MGIYIYIYIYYLIKYYRAGGYPPDQNSKNRYPSVIRIFKISVSVRIYASGQVSGSAGLIGRVGFHGFLPTPRVNGFAHPLFGAHRASEFQNIAYVKVAHWDSSASNLFHHYNVMKSYQIFLLLSSL